MTARLRMDQCCTNDGCDAPKQYSDLCARCFYAASPARRQVELLIDEYTPASCFIAAMGKERCTRICASCIEWSERSSRQYR